MRTFLEAGIDSAHCVKLTLCFGFEVNMVIVISHEDPAGGSLPLPPLFGALAGAGTGWALRAVFPQGEAI